MAAPHARTRLLLVGALALALLAGAGCSDDDDDSQPDTTQSDTAGSDGVEGAIAEELVSDDDPAAVSFTRDEAECAAAKIVAELGEGRLEELGVGDDAIEALDYSDEERNAVFDAIDGCVDLRAQLAELLGADDSLTAEEAACAADRYADSGLLQEAFFAVAGDEELNGRIDAALQEALVECAPGSLGG